MRISDWSSDVCSSDLGGGAPYRSHPRCRGTWRGGGCPDRRRPFRSDGVVRPLSDLRNVARLTVGSGTKTCNASRLSHSFATAWAIIRDGSRNRSEEHTSELQSLMRISYAVFCLKKKK